jgi:hypothetical protein
VDRDFVQRYGTVHTIPEAAVLIDTDFCKKFPEILPKLQFITATNVVLESKRKIFLLKRA